jgi:hypothetical protein
MQAASCAVSHVCTRTCTQWVVHTASDLRRGANASFSLTVMTQRKRLHFDAAAAAADQTVAAQRRGGGCRLGKLFHPVWRLEVLGNGVVESRDDLVDRLLP